MTSQGARPTVHDLQAMAREAARPRRRPATQPSRAARLHLIDSLSRWGGGGLALVAGLSIFIAVAAGRAYPFRAAVWALIMLAALHVCRRLRAEFRAGGASAARPFRWRANYTAALTVVGAAFGAGSVIVTPEGASPAAALETLALILAGALVAGMLHAAHGRSAAALFAPAAAFGFLGAWRAGGPSLAIFGAGALFIAGGLALFLVSRHFRKQAMRRFPRTAFVRREAATRTVAAPERDTSAAAAN